MKLGKHTTIAISAAIVLAVGAVALLCGVGGEKPVDAQGDGRDVMSWRSRQKVPNGNRVRPKRSVRIPDVTEQRKPLEKPDFSSESEDDAELSAVMRDIFKELKAALDADNRRSVFALVHKLQSMDEWPDGIPKKVKLKALDALAWFGAAGIAEAVGFLGDSDAEVVQTAVEKFADMLFDADGDIAKANIIKPMAKAITDAEMLDSVLFELDMMRPTIKAETVLAMMDSGNQLVIDGVKENMDMIFSDAEVEITDREGVEKYRQDAEAEYQADPEKAKDDADFYGPQEEG